MAKKGAKCSKRTKSVPSTSDGPALGISKLKSQLRQANRLLRKEGLSPELRSATEQRISQIQASMGHVPSKEQERRNAIKYHKIKFFGRLFVILDHRSFEVLIPSSSLSMIPLLQRSQKGDSQTEESP
jgi:hypothetical protein